jgi:hypothetical protein
MCAHLEAICNLFKKKASSCLLTRSNAFRGELDRVAQQGSVMPSLNSHCLSVWKSRSLRASEGFRYDPFSFMTCFRAQESSTRRTGRNFLPKGVDVYSTLTGISANISLLTSPSLSSSRSCCVSTFCEIRGILCRRPLNRRGSSLFRSHHRITGFHRPPISTSSSSIGHMLAIRLAPTGRR